MPPHLFLFLGLCLAAYLSGSIPFGLILARRLARVDLRRMGSGNIGATNARRAGGWRLGLAVLVCDAAKGALPVAAAGILIPYHGPLTPALSMCAAALCAVAGHVFPVFLKGQTGGKGVSTAAGCFAVIAPLAMVVSLMVFLLAARISRRVSVGSLAGTAVLPPAVFLTTHSFLDFGCATLIALMVILRHWDNIQRLLNGTEPGL